ncbi:hypothetical protein SDC9_03516 [bioreactor metagenome]|uniref:DNA alkylation repair enzyme n=1 Tax=bioreactor metagenome TaxID=1076179 RepID=A0A644SWH0_9ZZZZ|nr:DNA alkylation repair protein [Methanobrevibacter sp.]MEA4956135.1 DNA alkylation repair protein [Methanobrevibacter sp.]
MKVEEIINLFEELSSPEDVEGMSRFGITPEHTYGLRMPVIKKIAKEYKKDHLLALNLWNINTRETRILASLVDDPNMVTSEQMDKWANDFDYWEICDQCCINLFRKTSFAYEKIDKWTKDDKEFVKRAGFAMIAVLAVHDKKEKDEKFISLLDIIERESDDDRNLVKKAVNWALRQIGKRNMVLNKIAIIKAKEIDKKNSKSAHWIAKNAIKELTDEKTVERIKLKE